MTKIPERIEAAPVLDDLEAWLRVQLGRISGKTPMATAMLYALMRIPRLRLYLDDGRLELDNNTAERGVRGVPVRRKNWIFVGSEGGGNAAAIGFKLIETAKLNGIVPQAWLTSAIGRIADHKTTRIDELLPWRYVASAA